MDWPEPPPDHEWWGWVEDEDKDKDKYADVWPPPVSLIVVVVLWVLALSVDAAVSISKLSRGHASHSTDVRLAIVAAACCLSTMIPGALVGYRKKWPLLVPVGGIGTLDVLFWYLWSAATDASPEGANDNAAGVGLVILALPVFLAILALLLVGAAPAATARRLRRRTEPNTSDPDPSQAA